MDGGRSMARTGGCGFRGAPGRQRGWRGGGMRRLSAGRPCLPKDSQPGLSGPSCPPRASWESAPTRWRCPRPACRRCWCGRAARRRPRLTWPATTARGAGRRLRLPRGAPADLSAPRLIRARGLAVVRARSPCSAVPAPEGCLDKAPCGVLPSMDPLFGDSLMSGTARAPSRPIRRVLAANRGEIAIRIFRAATELGMGTVAIYSDEDRLSLHRYKADEAYLVGKGKGPVEAYLGIDEIIALAREKEVDAIHPGYGFLSENPEFAERVEAAGLVFVGPTAEQQRRLGDKVAGRRAALEVGVPVVPGTDGPVEHEEEALVFARAHGYPLIVKAAGGGGGRGMRVARDRRELLEGLASARSEARAAFGNPTIFLA